MWLIKWVILVEYLQGVGWVREYDYNVRTIWLFTV